MDDNAARTRTPTPNALLLGASRPLSDILEVAAHNALDHASCMLHLRAHGLEDGQGSNAVHSASSFGSSSGSSSVGPRGCGAFGMPLGPEGSHTTFTVRTPFGKRCARDNGALGWLTHHRDEHGLAMWDSQGPWPGGIDVGGGRGVGGASKAHGMGGRGYTVKSNGNGVRLDTSGGVPMMTATATGSRPLTWFSDRTTKALVLITTTTNRKSTTDKNNCSRSRSVEQGLGEGETAGRDNSTRIAGLMASGVDAGGFGCVHGVTICGGSNRDDCGDRCCADLPWVGSVKVLDAPATMVSGDPPDTGEGSDRRRVMWLGANNNRCNIGDNDRVANYPSDDHRKGEISAPAAFPCTTCISSSTSSGSRGKRRRRPWEEVRNKLNKPSVADAHVTGQPSREGRREDYSSDIAKMPAPQAPSPRTSLGGTTRTREGGGVPCDGPGIGSVEGRDWVRKGDEHGDSRKAAVPVSG